MFINMQGLYFKVGSGFLKIRKRSHGANGSEKLNFPLQTFYDWPFIESALLAEDFGVVAQLLFDQLFIFLLEGSVNYSQL